MIIDQLFTPKPLREGGPYDLPGKDYDRPGDTPRKRPSGEHNPYPYSKEEDDDHFREIFRKKREAAKKAPEHKSLSEALELYFGKNSKPISEGNRNKQLRLMEETTFRNGYAFARLLVEKNLTKDQVLQLFKDVEQGATAAGGNRTGLGKAKDATTQAIGSVQKMLSGARKWVKERPTYQAVDTEYNRAMTALGKVGGESGEANAVTRAIYKYRDMAKKYPRATGLAKWAIISAAGFLTGGLGGAGVMAGLAAIDSALKDKEIIDIVSDAGYAAAVGGAIQGAGDLASAASDAYYGMPNASEIAANNAALGDWNDTDIPGGPASNINGLDLPPDQVAGLAADGDPNIVGPGEYSDAANNAYQQNPDPSDAPVDPNTRADYTQPDAGSSTYTVTADDVKGLGKIAQDNGLTAKQLWDANPQITDPDKIFVGQEINIPAASGEPVKNVWQDWDGPTKPTAPAVEPGPGDDVPTLSNPAGGKIDYTAPGPESTDSLGQKLEYGIPVNDQGSFIPPNSSLPAEELAKQTAAYNSWKEDFMKRNPNTYINADGNPVQIMTKPTLPAAVQESVKFKIIPAEQLIDQKLTVLSWALNESVNRKGHQSVHLTTKGVRTVFENIGRCRRAYLKEYIGAPTTDYGHPTAAGAPASATAGQGKPQGWFGKTLDTIGRGVDKVGSYVSNVGHNVITKVTADKLNNMWNRAGEPYDSNRLYQLLTTEWGVPKQVVDSVFSKMGIPYTAPATVPAAQTATPATTGGAQKSMPFYGTNPATGQARTYDELLAKSQAGTASGAATGTATNPDVAAAYNASLKAGKPASIPRPAAGPKTMGARRTNVKKPIAPTATNVTSTYGPGFKNSNQPEPQGTVLDLDKFKKDRAAKQDFAKSGYMAPASESRIAAALKRPVAEMLQMVETKEDVQRIKQFVDDTFVKYGAVNESAFMLRNQILEHVTQSGAQRRREHSQRVAH